MTPNRAATVFRELLQTSDPELGQFARRAGLHGQPEPQDLMRARELLEAVAAALESNRRTDWSRLQDAWRGLRAKHAPVAPAAAADALGGYVSEPARPGWVRSEEIPKPSLGSPAPGTAGAGPPGRAKFVPVARPRHVSSASGGGPDQQAGAAPEIAPLPAGAAPTSGHEAPPSAAPPGVVVPTSAADPLGRPQPAVPAMLAPVAAGSALPTAPQAPEGFTAQAPSAASVPHAPVPAGAASPPVEHAAAPASPPPPPHRAVSAAPSGRAPHGGELDVAAPSAADDDAGSIHHSVAKYAAFCAACAEAPERTAETMASYGVGDADQRAALDDSWQDRFDDEPELLSRWEQLFAHFRSSLRRGR